MFRCKRKCDPTGHGPLQTVIEPITERPYQSAILAGSESLIIALHGWGQSIGPERVRWWKRLATAGKGIPWDFAADSGLVDFARSVNASLVFPESKRNAWDDDTKDFGNPDLQYVVSVYSHATARQSFERIYLLGFSQGASFAHIVFAYLADYLDGAVFHSGPGEGALISSLLDVGQKRIAVVWGSEDPFVKRAGAATQVHIANSYASLGCDVKTVEVDGMKHRWWRAGNQQLWEFLSS